MKSLALPAIVLTLFCSDAFAADVPLTAESLEASESEVEIAPGKR
jgi:hypothetical protein